MTLLIGTIVSTGSGAIANGFTGARLVCRDFVASATGSLETISYLDNESDDDIVFFVYSAAGALLGKSGLVSSAAGTITGTLITPVPVVSGTTYKLCAYCISGYFRFLSNGATPAQVYDGGSYLAPSANITTVDEFGIEQMQLWGAGTLTTGSTATPSGVSTSTGIGTASATGAAKATPSGVATATAVGTVISPVKATPLGVSTSIAAGYSLPYIGVCSFVTLTSVNTSAGYLGAEVTLQVGFKIAFQTAASLGLSGGQVNYIDVDGGIYTDFDGTQYLSVFNPTNGVTLQITLINGDVAGTVAVPSGVATSTGVGAAVATGAAKATPSGVSVATAVGTPFAPTGSIANPLGVATATAVGTSLATGAAKAAPLGVAVATAVGTATILAGNAISDINGGQPVLVGSTGNTIIVTNGFTPTSGTIGGIAVTNIQGTTPNFTFDMPNLVEGQTHPGYGSKTAIFTNGASSPQRSVVFNPKAGQDYVTLAGTIEQTIKGIGYGFSPALAVNDQVEFPSPAVVVGTNAGYPNTKAVTGSHLCKHISRGDNKIRYFLLKVGP